jgi:hypothetical protein
MNISSSYSSSSSSPRFLSLIGKDSSHTYISSSFTFQSSQSDNFYNIYNSNATFLLSHISIMYFISSSDIISDKTYYFLYNYGDFPTFFEYNSFNLDVCFGSLFYIYIYIYY